MFLLARNEEINAWLAAHPLVTAGIFGAIAALLLFSGIQTLLTGKARGKWGSEHEGGMAMIYGVVRLIGGLGCGGMAIFQLVKALS